MTEGDGRFPEAPVALLWTNGTAMYFDSDGGQVGAWQMLRWRGLSEFVAAYPQAPVCIAAWGAWVQRVPVEHVAELIGMLRCGDVRRSG